MLKPKALSINESIEEGMTKLVSTDSSGKQLLSLSYAVRDGNPVIRTCESAEDILPDEVLYALVSCLAKIEAQLGGTLSKVFITEEGVNIPRKSLFDCGFRLMGDEHLWLNPVLYQGEAQACK